MTISDWIQSQEAWETTSSKTAVLFPALEEHITLEGSSILDAGCGDGFFVRLAKDEGAQVVGIDISETNIANCRAQDPKGEYHVMDVRNIQFTQRFDYVVSFLVLLSFEHKKDIRLAIENMKNTLEDDGKLIIATTHPAFDNINENMETMTRTALEEYAYTNSGLSIRYVHKDKDVSFVDFHWTIEDYTQCITGAGMVLTDILEPTPIPQSKAANPEVYAARKKYPPFIIFVCEKR